MTATTGVVAPLEAMLNAMVKNMSPCILEQMKKYGCEILDNAGQIYGFDAEEAKRDFIYKIEHRNKVVELSIMMNPLPKIIKLNTELNDLVSEPCNYDLIDVYSIDEIPINILKNLLNFV